MTDWMTQWLNDWKTDWLTDCLTDWLTEWMNEWMNEWLNEWMNEWMNEGRKEGRKEEGRKEGRKGGRNEWMNDWWMNEGMNAKSTCIFDVYFSSVFLFGRKHPLTRDLCLYLPSLPWRLKRVPNACATLGVAGVLRGASFALMVLLVTFQLWLVRGEGYHFLMDGMCHVRLSRCKATPMIAKLAIRSVLCRLKNIPVWVFHCADDVTGWSF